MRRAKSHNLTDEIIARPVSRCDRTRLDQFTIGAGKQFVGQVSETPPQRDQARGAMIAVIRLPSIEGFFSTLPTSSRAWSTSCMTLRPSSM